MSNLEAIEGLHQRAAENYLQGEFQEALDAWRELLSLDPQDDRAIEGIRLCELLVQQSSGAELLTSTEDPAYEPPPAEPSEGSDVDFDEVAAILKEPEDAAGKRDATDNDPGWDFSALDVGAPVGDGLDLADLSSLDLNAKDAGDANPLDVNAVDPSAGEVHDIPTLDLDGPGDGDVEADIQARIAALLSQASTSYDAGDLEGALTLLDRVFVLDADNPVALALAEAFRSDIEERDEPQAGDGPVADAVADESLESLGLAGPASPDSGGGAPLVETPPELVPDDGALSSFDETPAEGDAKAEIDAAGAAIAPAGQRKKLLIGIGVVVALALAAVVGLRGVLTGGSDPGPAPQVQPVKAVPPTEPVDPGGSDTGVSETPDALVAPAAPATPKEDLSSVMARAQAALKAGKFSKAVVAYNEALQIEPGNQAAASGLSKAAAAYQEQRDFTRKLNAATDAFARSDYREALRGFYRLPGTDGVPRFDGFKANSWYNLGVGALKSGACNDAKGHLAEATALLPGDTGILAASRLAATCSRSQGNSTWYGDVERLTLRTLGD